MASSGAIRPLYGVVIRDKCKSSDVDTLKADKTVAEDLLKDHDGPDAKDLAEAVNGPCSEEHALRAPQNKVGDRHERANVAKLRPLPHVMQGPEAAV